MGKTLTKIKSIGFVNEKAMPAKESNAQIEPRMDNIGTYRTELSISNGSVVSISGFVRDRSGVTSTYMKVMLLILLNAQEKPLSLQISNYKL